MATTMNLGTLAPIEHGTQRVGQPRFKLFQVTIKELWEKTKLHDSTVKYNAAYKHTNVRHITALRSYAISNTD